MSIKDERIKLVLESVEPMRIMCEKAQLNETLDVDTIILMEIFRVSIDVFRSNPSMDTLDVMTDSLNELVTHLQAEVSRMEGAKV